MHVTPGLPGQRASDFFVLPDYCPKIIHSLPKDLQAPPVRAKMVGCGSGGLQNHGGPQINNTPPPGRNILCLQPNLSR